MSNKSNKVLYTGVTNDIWRRVKEHKEGMKEGFTKKYKVNKLVFHDSFASIEEAIQAEKQIKSWPRAKKDKLISSQNKSWLDLSLDC